MKIIITFIVLLLANLSLSQTFDYLQASHPDTGEVYLIEAGKVVRVVTTDGKRHKDRLTIIDENTIALDGIRIPLSEVDKIKKMRNAWVYIIGFFAVIYGPAFVGVGILEATIAGNLGLGIALGATGVGLTYLGINGINPARGFKRYKGWEFKLVAVKDLTPSTN